MQELHPKLKEDLDRWLSKIGEEPVTGHRVIGASDVLKAHYLIVDHFMQEGEGIGGIGPRDLTLFLSTIGRQTASYGGFIKWKDELDICATLFFGLIKNHSFHDGNKRTALLTLLFHLWKIGRKPISAQKDFEKLALSVAENSLSSYLQFERFAQETDAEVKFISHFLRKNTSPIDKRNYMVTYRELNVLLQRFGFKLDYPTGHFIDVVQIIEEERFDFLRLKKEKRVVEKRVGVLSFPGWKKEVGKSEITKVRNLTKLTPSHGIDSDVFFKGATPLGALIDRYQGPMTRLANK